MISKPVTSATDLRCLFIISKRNKFEISSVLLYEFVLSLYSHSTHDINENSGTPSGARALKILVSLVSNLFLLISSDTIQLLGFEYVTPHRFSVFSSVHAGGS